MKITLKGVLKVVQAILPFLPGGERTAHAGLIFGRVGVQAPPVTGPIVPIRGLAVNIDAAFLAQIDGAQEIAQVIDPSNAVLFIVSGDSANTLREALGLAPSPVLSGR